MRRVWATAGTLVPTVLPAREPDWRTQTVLAGWASPWTRLHPIALRDVGMAMRLVDAGCADPYRALADPVLRERELALLVLSGR